MSKKILGNRMLSRVQAHEDAADLPIYQLGKKEHIAIPKKWILIGLTIFLFLLSIYLPPAFLSYQSSFSYSSTTTSINEAAKEQAITWFKNHPEADFDGDGLRNDLESQNSSNAYDIDYDKDGVSDYAELYITNTNPVHYDNAIIDFVKAAGGSVQEPFKINNIVLWADSIEAKARGSVVEIYENTYRFSNFSGWALFPEDGSAYQISPAGHCLLDSNPQNGAYKIPENNGDFLVYFSQEPLEECKIFSIFGKEYNIGNNFFSKALNIVLPGYGRGWIGCRAATTLDIAVNTEEMYYNDICQLNEISLPENRFERNQTDLEDLQTILSALKSQQNVLISLMSHETGESIIEIYGYTSRYNLLACDPYTGKDLGILEVSVCSKRVLDYTSSIQNYNYFKFKGCGFDSENKNRLFIIGLASDQLQPQQTEPTEVTEETTEPTEPTKTPEEEQEERLLAEIDAILYTPLSNELTEVLGPNEGRYQATYLNVAPENVTTFISSLKESFGFAKYYEEYPVEKGIKYILGDGLGNIVTIEHHSGTSNKCVLRFERYDGIQTVELKPEFFTPAQ